MRLSQLVGMRFKERPADATLESHAFLLRGGYARQVANGIYSLLPPGLRVVRKIERILRQEMDRIGGQEVLMPVVNPRELWEESGRYQGVGNELLRFKDRTGHDMVLAMTHEEAVVHLCRGEVQSHTQMPFMVYHIQTKFRDEPRSRGGLIRVREFTMKDGYSFHTTAEDLEAFYERCYQAYRRIFARCGLPEVVAVASDTGMMGGKVAHEFILLTECGEDTIVVSEDRSFLANREVAAGVVAGHPADPLPPEKVATPNCKTIDEVATFLGVPAWQTGKAVFYENDAAGRLVLVVVRGDREVNESKLAKIVQAPTVAAGDAKIRAAGAVPGYASPIGLDPQKVRLVIDRTIAGTNNLVVGANEAGFHCKNFNLKRDLPDVDTFDVIQVEEGDTTTDGKPLKLERGIEVGNIFQLGTKYSEALKMRFLDADGKQATPLMGCYGIGVGRLMSSVMEARRDQYGPKWPIAIAPWQVHLVALRIAQGGVRDTAEKLYADLQAAGLEVLFDDREGAQAGAMFADADLLGIPFRLIVSERNLKEGQVEWKRRDIDEKGTIPLADAAATVRGWVDAAIRKLDDLADKL
jgi:prolyl-tRNA synthetase